MKRLQVIGLILTVAVLLSGCPTAVTDPTPSPIQVEFTSLAANGESAVTTTTEFYLTFDVDPGNLTVTDVTVTGAGLDSVSGAGNTRTVAVSGITVADGDSVTVDLGDRAGYEVTPMSRTVPVYVAVTPPAAISRLVGITDGSSYSSFVQAIWFPVESTAALSTNDGPFLPLPTWLDSIADPGDYRLAVTDPDESATATVSFSIVSNDGEAHGVFHTNAHVEGTPVRMDFEPGQYHGQQGTPIFAIWVEDLDGALLQNLYVSQFPGANVPRGQDIVKRRPTCLPYWLHKAGRDWGGGWYNTDPANDIPDDIDAVTGAKTR